LSRNISTVEKAVILLVIVGAILGLGIYFIVIPAYNSVERVDAQIVEKNKQIESAVTLRNRELYLDSVMEEVRERAENVHEGFIGELTRTESIIFIQELLSNANFGSGLTAQFGIDVFDIRENRLGLTFWQGENFPRYSLRDFASVLNPMTEERRNEIAANLLQLEEEPWAMQLAAEYAAGSADEDEIAEALAIFRGQDRQQTYFWHTAVEMLKGNRLSDEDALRLNAFMRHKLAAQHSGIGVIRANFAVRMSYTEYLDFLDYLHNFPYRIEVKSATFVQDNDASIAINTGIDEGTGIADYRFELFVYTVKPMDLPEPETPADEEAGEEEEQ
jgi:hypothetical protein